MKNKIMIGTLAALCLVFGAAGSSSAVINDEINFIHDAAGLGFTPTSSDRIKFSPGDVYDGSFMVYNTSPEVTNVFAEVLPYSAGPENDYFNSDYVTPSDRTSISKWTTLDLEGCDITKRADDKVYFTLRVKEECTIKYHIEVPQDAYGGSQRAAIMVQTVERKDQGGGGIVSLYRVGYLLSADVSGPGANYEGEIIRNHVPWILLNPPAYTEALVSNTGNIDFDVKYSVIMHNFFGGKMVYENETEKSVLASSRYSNVFQWEGAPILGLLKVTQKVEALGKESEVTKIMLIIPIWLVIIILSVILLLVTARIMKSREKRRIKKKGVYDL